MKKILGRVTGVMGLIFLCIISVIAGQKSAKAQTVIPLGDTWTSGDKYADEPDDDRHWYQFTIPSDGKVTVTCQSDIYSLFPWTIHLTNEEYTESYGSESSSRESLYDEPKASISEYLKAGTYGMQLKGDTYDIFCYKVKAEFWPVDCNVPEPNNDFASATPISLDQLKQGLLTQTNTEDYFKVELSKAMMLQVVTTGEKEHYATLYDKDFTKIKEGQNAGSCVLEEYLSPGTYYVGMKIYGNDYDTPYTLKCTEKQDVAEDLPQVPPTAGTKDVTGDSAQPSPAAGTKAVTGIQLRSSLTVITKGQTANLLSSVTPSDATQKTLKWSTSDNSVATVSSTGKVTARAVGYAYITAATTDGTNISRQATVVVKPGKAALKKLKLYKYDKRQISIKAKAQKNVSYQYQYAKNKKFKKAKSLRSSSAAVTTKRLSKKKKYYVRVRAYYTYNGKNYYGAWSKAKSIRTKK